MTILTFIIAIFLTAMFTKDLMELGEKKENTTICICDLIIDACVIIAFAYLCREAL